MIKNIGIFSLFVCRFLKPKGRFFPHIGVVMATFAVSISTAILIIVMSVMNGFTAELIKKILGLNAHITLYSVSDGNNVGEIKKNLLKIHGIKLVIPTINGSGMLIGKNKQSNGVFIKGISKEDLLANKDLSSVISLTNNEFSGFKIIIGKELARQLGVKIGNEINLVVPVFANTMFGVVPRQVKLKIFGFINSNSQQYDNYMAILPFETAKRVFNVDNFSAIEIITDNPENIDGVEQEILRSKKFYLTDWKMENDALLHALKVEANVMSIILSFFVIISTFTIFAVIKMMIRTKEKEIAILKAYGVSKQQIGCIFFFVGFIITIVGLCLGNILGISFAVNVDNIRIFLENTFHTTLFDGSVYLLSNLPSKLMIKDVIKINIFAFITSIICVFLSAKKSTQINTIKILKSNQ